MIALRKDCTSWNSFKTRAVLLEVFDFLNSIYKKVNADYLFINS
jgi:hypothetical protein